MPCNIIVIKKPPDGRLSYEVCVTLVVSLNVFIFRTHICDWDFDFDQQAGGQRYIAGGGETHLEKVRRRLARKEAKIKSLLHQIRAQRACGRSERLKKKVAQVAVVGYTNAGELLRIGLCYHCSRMGKHCFLRTV